MAALQFVTVPNYAALILRKSFSDLNQPGALIPRSMAWLGGTDANWSAAEHAWHFPSGAVLKFGYLDGALDIYQYQCFTPDTELLTEAGWKWIADVETGDLCATMNPSCRLMEYKPAAKIHKFDYDGDMIERHQRNGVSFCVTPNHTIWASTLRTTSLRPFRADALTQDARVPQWCLWDGKRPDWKTVVFRSDGHNGRQIEFQSREWCSFMGWYLAEGCVEKRSRWAIHISQCNERGRGKLRDLFQRLPSVNVHESPRDFSFNNKRLCQYLAQFGYAQDKFVPSELKHLDQEHLQLLLNGLIEGDGCWEGDDERKGRFISSSPRLIDDVMEIGVKCGYIVSSGKAKSNPPESVFGQGDRWYISLRKGRLDTRIGSRDVNGKWQHTNRVAYKGKVFCVTVPPYHTVLIRRKGRVSWSGQSAEFTFIGYDELSQFREFDYRYMFSRLRRPAGMTVPLRCRAASNPGGTGHEWVKRRFIIEGRTEGRLFIPARLDDNPHIDRAAYIKSMDNLDPVTRKQLLDGDWTARQSGSMFRREWFQIVDVSPARNKVRFWDLAASEPTKKRKDPDWTCGGLLGFHEGIWYLEGIRRFQALPKAVEDTVRQTAELDGRAVPIRMEQEPGASGKSLIDHYARNILPNFNFAGVPSIRDKVTRAGPFSSAAEGGRFKIVNGTWVNGFLDRLECFPDLEIDDECDCVTGGMGYFREGHSTGFQSVDAVNKRHMTRPEGRRILI